MYLCHLYPDVQVLAPLSALLLGVLAVPLVAARLVLAGLQETPAAIVNVVDTVLKTRQFGPVGKIFLLPLGAALPLLLLILAPLWGAVAGFLHGAATGWMFVTLRTEIDILTWPTERLVAAYRSIATYAYATPPAPPRLPTNSNTLYPASPPHPRQMQNRSRTPSASPGCREGRGTGSCQRACR